MNNSICKNSHSIAKENIYTPADGRKLCLTCHRERARLWHYKNLDRSRAKSRLDHDKRGFNGLRVIIILRDGEACIKCGMTRDEHQEEYKRDITVDHIDKNRKNNSPSNLQTLCIPCHTRKDSIPKKLSREDVINIRHSYQRGTAKLFSELYKVSTRTINQIIPYYKPNYS